MNRDYKSHRTTNTGRVVSWCFLNWATLLFAEVFAVYMSMSYLKRRSSQAISKSLKWPFWAPTGASYCAHITSDAQAQPKPTFQKTGIKVRIHSPERSSSVDGARRSWYVLMLWTSLHLQYHTIYHNHDKNLRSFRDMSTDGSRINMDQLNIQHGSCTQDVGKEA